MTTRTSETLGPKGWQPIETAPWNTSVLVASGRQVLVAVHRRAGNGFPARWTGPDADDFTYGGPSYWMPLPAPPVAAPLPVQGPVLCVHAWAGPQSAPEPEPGVPVTGDALAALVVKWRAQGQRAARHPIDHPEAQRAEAIRQCADELEAALRSAPASAPPEPAQVPPPPLLVPLPQFAADGKTVEWPDEHRRLKYSQMDLDAQTKPLHAEIERLRSAPAPLPAPTAEPDA